MNCSTMGVGEVVGLPRWRFTSLLRSGVLAALFRLRFSQRFRGGLMASAGGGGKPAVGLG
jgi:hypothetical protein